MRQSEPVEQSQEWSPQRLARSLVRDPLYLKKLAQRLRRGQAAHMEPYFWMAAATKQKDTVATAGRIITTCPLIRAGFPDGRTCEDCICGAKQFGPANYGRRPSAPAKPMATPRQGLDFIRTLLRDPYYRSDILHRLRTGRLPAKLELYLWRLAFGKLDEMEARLQPRDFHIVLLNEVKDPLKRPRAAPPAPQAQSAGASDPQSPARGGRVAEKIVDEPASQRVISLPDEGSPTGMADFVIPEDPQVVEGPICDTCVGVGWVRNDRGNDVEPCQRCAGRGRYRRLEDS